MLGFYYIDFLIGFKHRDIVIYHHTNNIDYLGNITTIYTDGTNTLSVKTKEKHFKRVFYKRCKLFYRFDKIGGYKIFLYNFI